MTDESTQRIPRAQNPPPAGDTDRYDTSEQSGNVSARFDRVLEQPSIRPDTFADREGPTLASPESANMPGQVTLEQRLITAVDRIGQLESDFESLYARIGQLTDAINAEQLRGRAARMGRYLLWGAVIAAMATFWMMLRLHMGSH
jgi:hypothetical protein